MVCYDTSIMFIRYVGTLGGTAMAKALKNFAHENFGDSLIDMGQVEDVASVLRDRSNVLKEQNPRWKQPKISCDSSRGIKHDTCYITIDSEIILIMKKAERNYAPF